MCGLIIGFILLMIVAAAYLMGIIAIGIIVILIGLLASIGNYKKAKSMKPSKMLCPNCGSKNIWIQKEVSGISGSGVNTDVWAWNIHSGNHNINRQRVGVCQDCGFDYSYITQDEINDAIERARGIRNLWIILALIVLLGGFALYLHSGSETKEPVHNETETVQEVGKAGSNRFMGKD